MGRHSILLLLLLLTTVTGCRVARYAGEGKSVVSRVEIRVDGELDKSDQLKMALKQRPYRRTFGFLPISAWLWHPDDSTMWHRLRQRLGTAPAIYSDSLTRRTDAALQRVMYERGFLDATCRHDTATRHGKTRISYYITAGRARRVTSLRYVCTDPSIQQFIDADTTVRQLRDSVLLDRQLLEGERQRLTALLREQGYWDFNKENVTYVADTLEGSGDVELTCLLAGMHQPYHIRYVHFEVNPGLTDVAAQQQPLTRRQMLWHGYDVAYAGDNCPLRDRVLVRNSFVLPNALYSERNVRDTYAAMSRLHILRYVNIRLEPVEDEQASPDKGPQLDCYISLTPQPTHGIELGLDGSNTAGDLGAALAATYQHRNVFKGSEAFMTRVKGSYEHLSGNIDGLVNDYYREYGAEVGLDFPQFLFPFLSDDTRRRSRATTYIKASYVSQSRPEYDRNVAQGAITYRWNSPSGSARHMLDVINLSYVRLPKQSASFQELIQHLGPIIYSSYTSHFIVGADYAVQLGNNLLTTGRQTGERDLWSLRINPELAGSLLYLISKGVTRPLQEGERYHFLGLPFEQYARFDVDWSYSHVLTGRSRLALHAATGVAVPFGNSNVMPFEKRYYAGGANSVRGWSVRGLGPGKFAPGNSAGNYFNQCGDVRLDASVELRTRLAWKMESALFVDAGNVWTIKEYENQRGGAFTSDFYKQIALAWGFGIRFVSDIAIIRLDLGFKAYDPASDANEAWPLSHPFRNNNHAFHFAVGYPF